MDSKVQKFAESMQAELEANSHKGSWEEFTKKGDIISEYVYHFNKLEYSMALGKKEEIKEHIADCANILMMLGNSYELY